MYLDNFKQYFTHKRKQNTWKVLSFGVKEQRRNGKNQENYTSDQRH